MVSSGTACTFFVLGRRQACIGGLFVFFLIACGVSPVVSISLSSAHSPSPLTLPRRARFPGLEWSTAARPFLAHVGPPSESSRRGKSDAQVCKRPARKVRPGQAALVECEVAEFGPSTVQAERRGFGEMLDEFRELAGYKVTQILGASTAVKLISLFVFSIFLVVGGGAMIKAHQSGVSWSAALFKAYALLNNAPGTSAVDEKDAGASLIVNTIYIIGILTFATALGVITSSMELALERILADDHKIIEKNHILILNWNEMVPPMLRQIEAAIKDGVAPRTALVILADKDKKEMKDAVDGALNANSNLHVMIRSGNPGTLANLHKVSAGSAKFVLILTPEGRGGDHSDLDSVKGMLTTQAACLRSLQRRKQPNKKVGVLPEDLHVVIAAPYEEVHGLFRYTFYQQRGLQQRVLALSTIQPGLARVHEEIFDQEKGCQLYLHPAARWPWLPNKTFAEASQHFPSSVLLGWVSSNPDSKSRVNINPNAHDRLPEGSEVILLDRQREVQCHRFPHTKASFPPGKQDRQGLRGALKQASKSMLVLNYHGHTDLLKTLDDDAHAGSTITVVSNNPKEDLPRGKQVRIKHKHGSALNLQDLAELDVLSYDTLILLSTTPMGYTLDQSDAMVLTTANLLMTIRRRLRATNHQHLLAAMQDPASMPLLKATCARGGLAPDTVFANELESGCIAQVVWTPDLQVIYEDFLDVGGGELTLVDASFFGSAGSRLSFSALSLLAIEKGAVALGIMKASGRLKLSPDKMEELVLEKGDRVALFGEVRAR